LLALRTVTVCFGSVRRVTFSYSHCFFRLTAGAAQFSDSGNMTTQKSHTSPANTPDQPAAGKGMPAKDPQAQAPMVGKQLDLKDGSASDQLELPSDRDQAQDMTSSQSSPHIEQAAKDLKDGKKDTSKAPEMDAAYKKQKP